MQHRTSLNGRNWCGTFRYHRRSNIFYGVYYITQFRWALCWQYGEYSQHLPAKDVESWKPFLHLFTSCPFTVQFWAKASLTSQIVALGPVDEFSSWYSTQALRTALPPLGVTVSPLIPWLLWRIARNKLVFEGKIFQVEDIISKATADARAWENANSGKKLAQKKLNPVRATTPHPLSCWIDGAWQESTRAGGMGWIIKNEEGAVLCRGSSNRIHVGSALVAEALAMRDALKKANDLHLQSLHIFSDSQSLLLPCVKGGI